MQHDLKFYSNSNRLENATGLYWANIPAHNNTGWLNSSRPDLSSYLIFKAKVWSEKKKPFTQSNVNAQQHFNSFFYKIIIKWML